MSESTKETLLITPFPLLFGIHSGGLAPMCSLPGLAFNLVRVLMGASILFWTAIVAFSENVVPNVKITILFIMDELLSWKEPRAVTLLNWRKKYAPALFRGFFPIVKWMILICCPVLVASYFLLPEGFLLVLYPILFIMAWPFFPVSMSFLYSFLCGNNCSIINEGIISHPTGHKTTCYWKELKSYDVDDYNLVPGVRVLKLKIERQGREVERELCFFPQDISEPQLKEILGQYLPQTTEFSG